MKTAFTFALLLLILSPRFSQGEELQDRLLSTDVEVRTASIEELKMLSEKELSPYVEGLLQAINYESYVSDYTDTGDLNSDNTATSALAELGLQAVPSFINLLKSEDVDLRRKAAFLLSHYAHFQNGKDILPIMYDVIFRDEDEKVRRHATESFLNNSYDPTETLKTIDSLIEKSSDKTEKIRRYAIQALGRLLFADPQKIAPVLIATLDDQNAEIRLDACKYIADVHAIGWLGTWSARTIDLATPRVLRLLNSNLAQLKECAIETLITFQTEKTLEAVDDYRQDLIDQGKLHAKNEPDKWQQVQKISKELITSEDHLQIDFSGEYGGYFYIEDPHKNWFRMTERNWAKRTSEMDCYRYDLDDFMALKSISFKVGTLTACPWHDEGETEKIFKFPGIYSLKFSHTTLETDFLESIPDSIEIVYSINKKTKK